MDNGPELREREKEAARLALLPHDRLNRAFDPGKFLAGPDGHPRLDTLGRYIPKGLGRRPYKETAATVPRSEKAA